MQNDRLSRARDSTLEKVHLEFAHAQDHWRFGEGRTAPESIYPGEEFDEGKRFDKVVIAAGFEAFDAISYAGEGAQKDYGRSQAGGSRLLDHSESIQPRNHPVDHRGLVGSRGQ